MTKREEMLHALVKQEDKNLKKHALKKELKRLDFESLDPSYGSTCIYGQATGSCNSDRAIKLINSCAKRTYSGSLKNGMIKGSTLKVNGQIDIDKRLASYFGGYTSWSPIEVFILNNKNTKKESNNKALIDYLKGDRKTLIFK